MIDGYDLKHPGKVCSFRKRPHGRRNDDEKSHLDGLMVHQCDGNEKDVSWNTFLNRMLAEDFLPCRAAWTISVMERKQIRQRSPRISFMRNMFWQAKRVMCRDNPFSTNPCTTDIETRRGRNPILYRPGFAILSSLM